MIIIGVMSDTHGNETMMLKVAQQMKHAGCVKIYHVGDTYRDSRILLDAGVPVIAVPGNWDAEFTASSIPNTRLDTVGTVTIGLVHDPLKITGKLNAAADILITGHTHHAHLYKEQGKIHINPGHLKAPRDRGASASYALIHIEGNVVRGELYSFKGTFLSEKTF